MWKYVTNISSKSKLGNILVKDLLSSSLSLGIPLSPNPPFHQVFATLLDPPVLVLVYHNTDTPIYVFPLTLDLSVKIKIS